MPGIWGMQIPVIAALVTALQAVRTPQDLGKLAPQIQQIEKLSWQIAFAHAFDGLGRALAGFDPSLEISFAEGNEPDNENALSFEVPKGQIELAKKLLAVFGSDDDFNIEAAEGGVTEFEASDSWHGGAEVSLRDLADAIGAEYGPFFSESFTVGEIQKKGAGFVATLEALGFDMGVPA